MTCHPTKRLVMRQQKRLVAQRQKNLSCNKKDWLRKKTNRAIKEVWQ